MMTWMIYCRFVSADVVSFSETPTGNI